MEPPGLKNHTLMLADTESEKTKWVVALSELHRILKRNNLPNRTVSTLTYFCQAYNWFFYCGTPIHCSVILRFFLHLRFDFSDPKLPNCVKVPPVKINLSLVLKSTAQQRNLKWVSNGSMNEFVSRMSVCFPPSFSLSANNEKEHGPRIELVKVVYKNFTPKRDLLSTLVYCAKVAGVINRDYSKERNGLLEKMFFS